MMNLKKNEEKALKECFNRLYRAAEPVGDFEQLMNEFKKNTEGLSLKEIDKILSFRFCDNYVLSEESTDRIINECIKEFKIKPKYRAQSFKNSIYLGPSPRFTVKKEE